MTSRIPTSTSVSESSVIAGPLAQVWHLIKLQDFQHFWSKIDKSNYVKGASPETDIVKWTFKDGTEQEVKQEEHSVRRILFFYHLPSPRTQHATLLTYFFLKSIDHFITYSVISSTPALTYSSVISTIRCYAVTTGSSEGSTFVQWSAHFSSDADAGIKRAC